MNLDEAIMLGLYAGVLSCSIIIAHTVVKFCNAREKYWEKRRMYRYKEYKESVEEMNNNEILLS